MPIEYEPYDPEKNWVRELHVGETTGEGRGTAGSVGNQLYRQKQQQAEIVPLRIEPTTQHTTEQVWIEPVLIEPPFRSSGPPRGGGLLVLAEWVERHLAPLGVLSDAGRRLRRRRWPIRLPLASAGAVLLFGMLASPSLWPAVGLSATGELATLAASHAWWLGTGAGAWLGWHAVSVVGAALMVSARLVALALALTGIGALLLLVYIAVALAVGWPVPF